MGEILQWSLLSLKMEEEATSQEIQAVSEHRKRQGNGFSSTSGRKSPVNALTSEAEFRLLASRTEKRIKFCFKPPNLC